MSHAGHAAALAKDASRKSRMHRDEAEYQLYHDKQNLAARLHKLAVVMRLEALKQRALARELAAQATELAYFIELE